MWRVESGECGVESGECGVRVGSCFILICSTFSTSRRVASAWRQWRVTGDGRKSSVLSRSLSPTVLDCVLPVTMDSVLHTPELLCEILSHARAADVVRARRVCVHWKAVIDADNYLWKRILHTRVTPWASSWLGSSTMGSSPRTTAVAAERAQMGWVSPQSVEAMWAGGNNLGGLHHPFAVHIGFSRSVGRDNNEWLVLGWADECGSKGLEEGLSLLAYPQHGGESPQCLWDGSAFLRGRFSPRTRVVSRAGMGLAFVAGLNIHVALHPRPNGSPQKGRGEDRVLCLGSVAHAFRVPPWVSWSENRDLYYAIRGAPYTIVVTGIALAPSRVYVYVAPGFLLGYSIATRSLDLVLDLRPSPPSSSTSSSSSSSSSPHNVTFTHAIPDTVDVLDRDALPPIAGQVWADPGSDQMVVVCGGRMWVFSDANPHDSLTELPATASLSSLPTWGGWNHVSLAQHASHLQGPRVLLSWSDMVRSEMEESQAWVQSIMSRGAGGFLQMMQGSAVLDTRTGDVVWASVQSQEGQARLLDPDLLVVLEDAMETLDVLAWSEEEGTFVPSLSLSMASAGSLLADGVSHIEGTWVSGSEFVVAVAGSGGVCFWKIKRMRAAPKGKGSWTTWWEQAWGDHGIPWPGSALSFPHAMRLRADGLVVGIGSNEASLVWDALALVPQDLRPSSSDESHGNSSSIGGGGSASGSGTVKVATWAHVQGPPPVQDVVGVLEAGKSESMEEVLKRANGVQGINHSVTSFVISSSSRCRVIGWAFGSRAMVTLPGQEMESDLVVHDAGSMIADKDVYGVVVVQVYLDGVWVDTEWDHHVGGQGLGWAPAPLGPLGEEERANSVLFTFVERNDVSMLLEFAEMYTLHDEGQYVHVDTGGGILGHALARALILHPSQPAKLTIRPRGVEDLVRFAYEPGFGAGHLVYKAGVACPQRIVIATLGCQKRDASEAFLLDWATRPLVPALFAGVNQVLLIPETEFHARDTVSRDGYPMFGPELYAQLRWKDEGTEWADAVGPEGAFPLPAKLPDFSPKDSKKPYYPESVWTVNGEIKWRRAKQVWKLTEWGPGLSPSGALVRDVVATRELLEEVLLPGGEDALPSEFDMLALGCGCGEEVDSVVEVLGTRHEVRAVAVDADQNALGVLSKRQWERSSDSLWIVCGDLLDVTPESLQSGGAPVASGFHLITLIRSLQKVWSSMEVAQRVMCQIAALLAPNGLCVIIVPSAARAPETLIRGASVFGARTQDGDYLIDPSHLLEAGVAAGLECVVAEQALAEDDGGGDLLGVV